MTVRLRWVLAALVVGAAPSFLHAAWTLQITCQGTSACGPISNPPQTAGTFSTQSDCEAAKSAFACAVISCSPPSCAPCSVTNTIKVCTETGATGGGGGGGGADGPTVQLPGSIFLPDGTLLSQSQFEQIAGGFHGMGDISMLGSEFGDAFFSPHYTHSFQGWVADFQRRMDWLRQAGDLGADAPSLFSGTEGPAATREYENDYADELSGSDFFKKLQTGQAGPDPISGRNYQTPEEMGRQRLKDAGDSLVMTDGMPVDYSQKPQVTVDGGYEDALIDHLKDEALETGKGIMQGGADRLGYGDQYERVEEGGTIYAKYATGIQKTVEEAATLVAAGRYSEAEAVLATVGDQSRTLQKDVSEFVAKQFEKAASKVMGELTKLDFISKGTKEAYDQTMKMAKDAKQTMDDITKKVLEAKKAGMSDSDALQHATKKFLAEKAQKKGEEYLDKLVVKPFKKEATDKVMENMIPSREVRKTVRETIRKIPGTNPDQEQ